MHARARRRARRLCGLRHSGASSDRLDDTTSTRSTPGSAATARGVTVAVVDTGIKADHEDLAGQIAGNAGELAGEPGIDDDDNGYVDDVARLGLRLRRQRRPGRQRPRHARRPARSPRPATTASASIGVAPQAKVLPLRALDDDGGGCDERHRRRVRLRRRPRRPDRQRLARRRRTRRGPERRHRRAPEHALRRRRGQRRQRRRRRPRRRTRARCRSPTSSASARPTTATRIAALLQLRRDDRRPVRARRRHPLHRIAAPTAYAYMSGTSMAAPHVAGAAALALAANPAATTSAAASGRCCPRSTPSPRSPASRSPAGA